MGDENLVCINLQRKIKDEIYEEAECNIDKINEIIDEDSKNNELLKHLIYKSKQIKQQ